MIIQSSNKPIKVKFPKGMDLTTIPKLRISLWQDDEQLKLWEKEEMEITEIPEENKYMVTLSLTQEETSEYIDGRCVLEIKGLYENGETFFAQQTSLIITDRYDKEVMNNE